VVAGVDVILDCMGASYYKRNLDSLNFDGRLFIIGFQGGVTTEVDLRPLLAKRLTVQGITNFILYPFLTGTALEVLFSACKRFPVQIKTRFFIFIC
jgi:NADPH:quinone reductase-like Zn-dependent oxidoreductase